MLVPMRRFWLVVGASLIVGSSSTGSAQPVPARAPEAGLHAADAPASEPQEVTGSEPKPLDEAASEPPRRLWDIVKVLPILFYTPETSLGFGVGTLFQFRMPGAVAGRRPSSITLGGV